MIGGSSEGDPDWTPTIDKAAEGVPGSGKTTWLMGLLNEELDDGVPFENVVMTTYRKSMAMDLQSRVTDEVFGGELPDDHYVRTTHSICWKIAGRTELIEDPQLTEVCDEVGVNYAYDSNDEEEKVNSSSTAVGNELFRLRSRCINTLRDPYNGWRGVVDTNGALYDRIVQSGGKLPERFNRIYEEYKEREGLVDFDDMLLNVCERGLSPPGMVVLMEDEFQDKTPLQIAVHDIWSDRAERTYVAGDVFQSLYSFQGTSPRFMQRALDEADESVVLDTSYRFGQRLWDLARQTLKSQPYDVPDIKAVGTTEVRRIPLAEYRAHVEEHSDESSLHLCRANFVKSNGIMDTLDQAGVIYSDVGKPWGWTGNQVTTYNDVVALYELTVENDATFGYSDYSDLSLAQLQNIIPTLPASGKYNTFLDSKTKTAAADAVEEAEGAGGFDLLDWVAPDGLRLVLTAPQTPFDRLVDSGLGGAKYAERMRQAFVRTDGNPISDIGHRMGTIHAAKGMEASVVFLHDKTTKRSLHNDADEEERVWYVGMTRPVDHLYVVSHVESPVQSLPI